MAVRPATAFMKQKEKGEIDKSTVMRGDFTTPFSVRDKTDSPKTSKDVDSLNSIIHCLVVIDIYRLLHLTKAKYMQVHMGHF